MQTPPTLDLAYRLSSKVEHFFFHGLLQLIPAQSRQQRTSCNSSTGAVFVSPSLQGLSGTSPLPQTIVLEEAIGEDVGGLVGEDVGAIVGFFVGGEVTASDGCGVGSGEGGFEGPGTGASVVGWLVGSFVADTGITLT